MSANPNCHLLVECASVCEHYCERLLDGQALSGDEVNSLHYAVAHVQPIDDPESDVCDEVFSSRARLYNSASKAVYLLAHAVGLDEAELWDAIYNPGSSAWERASLLSEQASRRSDATDPPAERTRRKRGPKTPKGGRPAETEKFEFYVALVEGWKREQQNGRTRQEFINYARCSELGERYKELFGEELSVKAINKAQTYLGQRNARHKEAENPEK